MAACPQEDYSLEIPCTGSPQKPIFLFFYFFIFDTLPNCWLSSFVNWFNAQILGDIHQLDNMFNAFTYELITGPLPFLFCIPSLGKALGNSYSNSDLSLSSKLIYPTVYLASPLRFLQSISNLTYLKVKLCSPLPTHPQHTLETWEP